MIIHCGAARASAHHARSTADAGTASPDRRVCCATQFGDALLEHGYVTEACSLAFATSSRVNSFASFVDIFLAVYSFLTRE